MYQLLFNNRVIFQSESLIADGFMTKIESNLDVQNQPENASSGIHITLTSKTDISKRLLNKELSVGDTITIFLSSD